MNAFEAVRFIGLCALSEENLSEDFLLEESLVSH
jgi:hypothetical protein